MAGQVKQVVVIGGANMDICGSPAGRLALRDSNPGTVRLRPGGVGRNIAQNLRLLGLEVSLITALGDDAYGEQLREGCLAQGVDMRMSCVLPGQRSSTYLYVTDEKGEMLTAVSDMALAAALTPERLAPHWARINAADAVLVDANLPEETLRCVAERCTAPLYADPVSTAKALRLAALLPRLTAIKPNALEAEALTGCHAPEQAARALLKAGVGRVYVSLSAEGMLAAEGETLLRLPCCVAPVVNTTGAGDAAMAALLWAQLQGFDLARTAEAALRAGAIACAGEEAINPRLAELPGELGR